MRDLTEGKPLKIILIFMIPILIANLFQQLYAIVDSIIVGKYLGALSLAAVGTTSAINFLVIGFTVGIGTGFAIITSQAYGQKNIHKIRNNIYTSVILSFVISIVLTIAALFFTDDLLAFMKVDASLYLEAKTYIQLIYFGIIFSTFYNLANGILRALGNSKVSLYIIIVASVLNIIFDIILIRFLNFGVAGAAYGTVISQAFSAVIGFAYIIREYPDLIAAKEDRILEKHFVLEHLQVAFPMALQFSITAIGIVVLQGAINSLGTDSTTAFAAINRIESVTMQIYASLGVAMASYCGQNFGAGKFDRIVDGLKKTTIITIGFALFNTVIMRIFSYSFAYLFMDNPNETVIAYINTYFKYSSLFYVILGLLFLYRNSLQGMGETLFPTLGGVLELVSRVVGSYLLPTLFGFVGLCLVGASAWVVTGVMLCFRMLYVIKKYKLKDITQRI